MGRRRGENFEGRNQLKLPADYAAYLLAHRGSSPMFQNEDGRFRAVEFDVDWEGKPAKSYGDRCGPESTFSIFEGKDIESPYKVGCDLDDNIVWNKHLHPPGLLPIGMDAGNSLFLLGVEGELAPGQHGHPRGADRHACCRWNESEDDPGDVHESLRCNCRHGGPDELATGVPKVR